MGKGHRAARNTLWEPMRSKCVTGSGSAPDAHLPTSEPIRPIEAQGYCRSSKQRLNMLESKNIGAN